MTPFMARILQALKRLRAGDYFAIFAVAMALLYALLHSLQGVGNARQLNCLRSEHRVDGERQADERKNQNYVHRASL